MANPIFNKSIIDKFNARVNEIVDAIEEDGLAAENLRCIAWAKNVNGFTANHSADFRGIHDDDTACPAVGGGDDPRDGGINALIGCMVFDDDVIEFYDDAPAADRCTYDIWMRYDYGKDDFEWCWGGEF